jgi:hypothetical protein
MREGRRYLIGYMKKDTAYYYGKLKNINLVKIFIKLRYLINLNALQM